MDFVAAFGTRIGHVHWKDMPPEMEARRGSIYGCGMGSIPLGDGVVGVPQVVKALKKSGFDGATTLEIAGVENVKLSARRLEQWWGE